MNQLKRIALLVLVVLFSMGACAESGVVEFVMDSDSVTAAGFIDDGGNFADDESSDGQSSGFIPTATLSPEAAALPWNLTLVNSTHPVPDDWTVELLELSNGRRVDTRMYPELQAMFDDCRAAGLTPKVNTAYRTIQDQEDILVNKYRKYKNQGMSHEDAQVEALKVAAYPGYSEHHLGLAVDITSSNTEKCSNSRVWDWMQKHCHEYGFIWRYPGEKTAITGISNEDWHFRYVGVEAATYIMQNQLCLEEYLEQKYGIK